MGERVELARLFSDLVRLETELWNAVDARLRSDFDLPLTWFEPMSVIDRTSPCRIFDIATALAITVGGTSKLVDRIESSGFCRRLANPADRRSSLIELTQPGRRLLIKATRSLDDELQTRLGSAASPRQLQQLQATLTTLRVANAADDSSLTTTRR
jgi:DNA-binding MarR family transcriptional regulator